MSELDSDRFKTRESAFSSLRDGIEDYFDALHMKQFDESLSIEVRARIRKLLQRGEKDGKVYAGTLVASMKLADNADYLDQVVDLVDGDDKQLIEKRISELNAK